MKTHVMLIAVALSLPVWAAAQNPTPTNQPPQTGGAPTPPTPAPGQGNTDLQNDVKDYRKDQRDLSKDVADAKADERNIDRLQESLRDLNKQENKELKDLATARDAAIKAVRDNTTLSKEQKRAQIKAIEEKFRSDRAQVVKTYNGQRERLRKQIQTARADLKKDRKDIKKDRADMHKDRKDIREDRRGRK